MGGVQTSSDSMIFLYDNYQVIREENDVKILKDKNTHEQLILKEHCFVNKQEYNTHFKRIREKEKQNRNLENVLRLVQLWSKEHNGVCSNIFKIYAVYQYPPVRLIDQIEARKEACKPFEQAELLSILQSCLNAFLAEPAYTNISPHLIYIVPGGILKLINVDFADSNYQTVYNSQYYYSPQKMEKFQSLIESREKQAAFSMGMTVLHSALLDSPESCYEISYKRMNKKKLDHFKTKLSKWYSNTIIELISALLQWQPSLRLGFDQIQASINQMCTEAHSIDSFVQEDNQQNIDIPPLYCSEKVMNPDQKQQKIGGSAQVNPNTSEITLSNYMNQVRKSQFEIICDPTIQNSIRKQAVRSEAQKNGSSGTRANKQNIFTDDRIMNMIKDGVYKIERSTKDRQTMREIHTSKDSNLTKPTPMSSSQDLLSQYELKTGSRQSSKQKDCTYVVQQYEDQSRYEGMMQNGAKNGYGKLIYPDGVFYEGNFKNDTLSGKGSLYYGLNRPAYVGDWENNKFNGFGTLYNEYPIPLEEAFDYSDFNKIEEQWIKFQGHFKEDIKQGAGKIVLTNGETIEAMFSLGIINGEGVFKDVNGKVIKGIWNGNKLCRLIQ